MSGDDCLCLDAANRVCRVGKQFLRARDEDSFPIRVYKAIIDLGAERMSEAEKIEELIAAYRMAVGDWAMSLEERGFAMMNRTEDALRDKIQSIITERDALRKVAQSHRGKQ